MSNGEIKVSLKETARLAWEEFREAWSLEPGGIEYGWLYNVQGWTKGGRISQTAQQFMNDLWKYMRENHGEISVEEAVAQQVLARFSADWEEHFTREFLAAKIGKGNHKSEGVKNMHWRISTILQGLQPPRPTPAQQQPSASSSSAQSAGNAESSTSSPVDDIDIFLSGDLYTILGFSASNYKNVTRHDVLEAFKRMALKWHPDKNHQHGQSTAVATMVMQKLVEAKEVLGGNPEDKKMYDSKLSEKRRRATQFAGQNSSSDPSVKPVVFSGKVRHLKDQNHLILPAQNVFTSVQRQAKPFWNEKWPSQVHVRTRWFGWRAVATICSTTSTGLMSTCASLHPQILLNFQFWA